MPDPCRPVDASGSASLPRRDGACPPTTDVVDQKEQTLPETPAQDCLKVALPVPLGTTFDYLPPAGLAVAAVAPGMRLEVRFGGRRLAGIVMAHGPCSLADPGRMRPAQGLLESRPVVPATLLGLARWASRYYQHPLGEALFSLLPPAMRRPLPLPAGLQKHWQIRPGSEPPARAPRQQALWHWLAENGPATTGAAQDAGFAAALLRALADSGRIEAVELEAARLEAPAPPAAAFALSPDQQRVLDAFPAAEPGYAAGLLHGVTGSGKTAVYLELITRALRAGRQSILLVPEISLTPQMLQRVTAACGAEQVAVMHSGIGEGERLQAWLDLRDGRRSVLVGARSAVLTPLRHPGLIIVDEEHDASYKQQDGFRYSARDLAVKRAQQEGIPVLLGSATPSLESLHNARRGRYLHLTLPQRIHGAPPPPIELLDVRHQEMHSGIARPLLARIRQHLGDGGQVLIFQNRRGYAPVLLCDDCGHAFDCPGCDRPLTVHLSRHMLCCHHCGGTGPIPGACPACGFRALTMLGAGTQRISDHLGNLFPDIPVIRVDRDAVRSQQRHAEIHARILAEAPAILVGTQMLAKGHDFPALTLVGVLDADGGLLSSDFRGLERTAQLITQVAGRAGRADRPGEVVLQTRRPDHPALQILVRDGYDALARHLLDERQAAGLPPFAALANVSADSPQARDAEQVLQDLREALQPLLRPDGGFELWGPVPAPMPRRAGRHRQQMVVWSASRARLQQVLPQIRARLDALPARRGLRVHLDVDPLDLY